MCNSHLVDPAQTVVLSELDNPGSLVIYAPSSVLIVNTIYRMLSHPATVIDLVINHSLGIFFQTAVDADVAVKRVPISPVFLGSIWLFRQLRSRPRLSIRIGF